MNAPAAMAQFGPNPDESLRLKSSKKSTAPGVVPPSPAPPSVPASTPASLPASGTPASLPASGTPASLPASGVPPSVAPPPLPVPVEVNLKSSNQTPALRDVSPALPAPVMACALTSVTLNLLVPFTDAVIATGPAPCAVKAKVAQFPRSGIPLGASPRIVAEPDRQRRIWTRPLESTTRSYRSPDGVSRRVKPFSGGPNPTRRASIRQSAHVTPRGAARSSWSRPAVARESVIQEPARMVQ